MEWISVKDRLPEYYEEVLVCNADKDSHRYSSRIEIGYYDEDDRWTSQDSNSMLDEVTHWMPLPGLPSRKGL